MCHPFTENPTARLCEAYCGDLSCHLFVDAQVRKRQKDFDHVREFQHSLIGTAQQCMASMATIGLSLFILGLIYTAGHMDKEIFAILDEG